MMPFAALCALFYGLHAYLVQRAQRYLSNRFLLTATFLFAFPFLGAFLYFDGIRISDPSTFIYALSGSFLLNMVSFPLLFRAISLGPLYESLPFTGLTPIYIPFVAALMIGERIPAHGFAGIFLIVAGVWLLNGAGNPLQAARLIWQRRSSRYALLAGMIWAVSGTIEKIAVTASTPAFYSAAIHLLLGAAFLIYSAIIGSEKKNNQAKGMLLPILLMIGLFQGIMALTQMIALTGMPVSYVIGIKRVGILAAILLALFVDGQKPGRAGIAGIVLMLSGVILTQLK